MTQSTIANILRDPAWQFFGVVIAVIGLFVAVRSLRRQTHRLAYESRISDVVSISKDLADDVQILFRGSEVKDVQLALLRIINVGLQPIRTADFERPLLVTFVPAQILTANVERTTPEKLDVELLLAGEAASGLRDSASVAPLLLNPGDSITLKFLLSGSAPKARVDARIANIQSIERLSINRESQLARLVRAISFALVTTGAGVMVARLPTAFEVAGLIFVAVVALLLSALFSQWIDKYRDPSRLSVERAIRR